jgi:hypothetical protein
VLATLERKGCLGLCRVYTLTVRTDGFVEFRGEVFVKEIGRRTKVIPPAKVAELVNAFQAAHHFALRNSYTESILSDVDHTVTSFTRNGQKKRIEDYGTAAPESLTKLEDRIDEIVDTSAWIGHVDWEPLPPCGACEEANCVEQSKHCEETGKTDYCGATWARTLECLHAADAGDPAQTCAHLFPGLSEPVQSYVDCLRLCCGSVCR